MIKHSFFVSNACHIFVYTKLKRRNIKQRSMVKTKKQRRGSVTVIVYQYITIHSVYGLTVRDQYLSLWTIILHACMGTTLNPSEPQFAPLKTGILVQLSLSVFSFSLPSFSLLRVQNGRERTNWVPQLCYWL